MFSRTLVQIDIGVGHLAHFNVTVKLGQNVELFGARTVHWTKCTSTCVHVHTRRCDKAPTSYKHNFLITCLKTHYS